MGESERGKWHRGVTFISEYVSLLSLFMNKEDKRNPDNWTKEELDRVVKVFEWLIKEDRKQNPHLYKKVALEERRNSEEK